MLNIFIIGSSRDAIVTDYTELLQNKAKIRNCMDTCMQDIRKVRRLKCTQKLIQTDTAMRQMILY